MKKVTKRGKETANEDGNRKGKEVNIFLIEGDLFLAQRVRRFAWLYDVDKFGQPYESIPLHVSSLSSKTCRVPYIYTCMHLHILFTHPPPSSSLLAENDQPVA